MPEEIIVRYRWSLEALADATRWRLRESGAWHFKWVPWITMATGTGLIAAGLLANRYDLCVWGGFASVFPLLVMRGWSRGFAKQLRRQYEASNGCDAEMEWRFTELTVRLRGPHGSADLTWGAFTKCVRTPIGIMLYTQPRILHWLPRAGFAAESEFVALADTARRKLVAYRELN